MKKILILFTVLMVFSPFTIANEVSEADTGTYVILKKDLTSTGMSYRLSKIGEKWIMEGKEATSPWKNITCDKGCDYRKTTKNEIATYFPSDWIANSDIACIQNLAQAFCKVSEKDNPAKVLHLVIALVTGKPTPMFLRRVNTK